VVVLGNALLVSRVLADKGLFADDWVSPTEYWNCKYSTKGMLLHHWDTVSW
jgi:hypothetical protein